MKNEMPVFVKIDDYKDVLDVMDMIKSRVEDAKETLGRINELKNQEDEEIEAWHDNLEDIERRVNTIDKSLFEPESV